MSETEDHELSHPIQSKSEPSQILVTRTDHLFPLHHQCSSKSRNPHFFFPPFFPPPARSISPARPRIPIRPEKNSYTITQQSSLSGNLQQNARLSTRTYYWGL